MSTQHTPAPWQSFEVGEFVTRLALADSQGVSLLTVVDEEGTKFAAVFNEADADLMLAAPELLAVCVRFAAFAEQGGAFAYPLGSLQELHLAIAKATGSAA